MAEATGEKELVKSFRSAGDLSGSSYTLPRFDEDSVSFKRQIRRSSGGFQLAQRGTCKEKRGRLDQS